MDGRVGGHAHGLSCWGIEQSEGGGGVTIKATLVCGHGPMRCPHGHADCCGHHDLEDVPLHPNCGRGLPLVAPMPGGAG